MSSLFSASTNSFWDALTPGRPDDCVPVTEGERMAVLLAELGGRPISSDENGKPINIDPPPPVPLTREQFDAMRLRAYSDPLTGSDRYFSESTRMQAMGEEGWEAVRDEGADRYREIQAAYPRPE